MTGPDDVVADPTSDAPALRDALAADPSLAARVAAHPHTDAALLRELVTLDDRSVDLALQWRQPPEGGWGRALHGPPAPPPSPPASSQPTPGAPVGGRRDAQPVPQESGGAPGPRRRARRRIAAAAALAVAVAVVALVLTRGTHTPSAPEVVAGVPTLAALPTTPTVRWTLAADDIVAAFGRHATRLVVGSFGGADDRGVMVASALTADARREDVLGVDLAAGRLAWVQPGPPNGRCTGQGAELSCTDPSHGTTCSVAGSPARSALCTSTVNGVATVTPYDLVLGSTGERTSSVIGTYGGDPVTARVTSDATSGAVRFSVARTGAVPWSTPLPDGIDPPDEVISDLTTLTQFVTLLDVPERLGLVVVHVAAGVACTHFSGDGGRCREGTTEDTGTTLLLDATTGDVVGTLDGEAELPVGDLWYVRTARGLTLQHADGSRVTDPRGLTSGTVVAVTNEVVVVSRSSRESGHTLTAVARDDGHDVWTQSGDLLATDGERLVVEPAGSSGAVHAVDADTGAQAWTLDQGLDVRVWGPYLAQVGGDGAVALLVPPTP